MSRPKVVRRSVLVVDDEPDLRELLRMELEGAGWDVEEAPNGREAWRLLERRDVDVVLTDLRMPGGSGLELAQRLHDRGAPPPELVVMSAYADLSHERARALGVSAFLSKPFPLEDVAPLLSRTLAPPPAP